MSIVVGKNQKHRLDHVGPYLSKILYIHTHTHIYQTKRPYLHTEITDTPHCAGVLQPRGCVLGVHLDRFMIKENNKLQVE